MTDTIRVLLVDDQELIRLGFRLVLEAGPQAGGGWRVVATLPTGAP